MNLKMENTAIVHVQFGKKDIPIHIHFEDRKHLSITVHPDMRITARAPAGKSLDEVQIHLRKRASWIYRQIAHFEQYQPRTPERKYVSGETHYYLGRQYRLKIKTGRANEVKLIGRYFHVELPDKKNNGEVRRLMIAWHRIHAKILFAHRIELYRESFRVIKADEIQIIVRGMKKRWGSCSGKKTITLNTELVKAPLDCIDYVIVHEMCHLMYPKHDNGFFRMLRRILPDWERRKERLEKALL